MSDSREDATIENSDDTRALVSAAPTSPFVPAGASRFEPGTLVASRFRIVSLLGSGGMGEVYRAEDIRLGQTVALKFLPLAVSNDPRLLERLAGEVRVGRQITHPNVCRIHDLGEWAGLHFLSMEYVEGEDLARLLPRIGRLSPDKAVELARDVCAGLAAAHAQGVLHRDLKPANVMVDARGHARITDLGLAQPMAHAAVAGDNAGTPAYMAPEQLDGAPASVRTDLYALGMVLYEMFTGRRAQSGRTVEEIRREKSSAPAPLSTEIPDVDPRVEAVILRCLAPHPEDRPRSVREVLAALPGGDPLAAALAAGETPSPQLVAAASVGGTLPSTFVLALFAVVVLLAGAAVLTRSQVSIWEHLPATKPREVLHDRILGIEQMAGVTAPPYTACGYTLDEARLLDMSRAGGNDVDWSVLQRGPSVLRYWCRRSPESLLATRMSGRTTPRDPPPSASASIVVVDHLGRLVGFEWTPTPSSAASAAVDWTAWMTASGLDPASVRADTPRRFPSSYADGRRAWTAAYPEAPGTPLRVEAATLQGHPVSFSVEPVDDAPLPGSLEAPRLTAYVTAVGLLVVAAALGIAWRAVRSGRGDRRGAGRLALVVGSVTLVERFLSALPFAGPWMDLLDVLGRAVRESLFTAALVWAFYMAVEPLLRRRWPELLVAWTRLISGRPDPLVGRDMLVGCAVGLVHACSVNLANRTVNELISEMPDFVLAGGAIGHVFRTTTGAILFALMMMLILAGLAAVLRRRVPAALAAAAVMLVAYYLGISDPRARVIAVIIVFVLIGTLFRFGLLAFAINQFVFLITLNLPLTPQLGSWRASGTIVWAITVAAVAGTGLWLALRPRGSTGLSGASA